MAIRNIVTRGFGNGTYDPGVILLPTRGYSIGASAIATVLTRFSLVGTAAARKTVAGTSSTRLTLPGTSATRLNADGQQDI